MNGYIGYTVSLISLSRYLSFGFIEQISWKTRQFHNEDPFNRMNGDIHNVVKVCRDPHWLFISSPHDCNERDNII